MSDEDDDHDDEEDDDELIGDDDELIINDDDDDDDDELIDDDDELIDDDDDELIDDDDVDDDTLHKCTRGQMGDYFIFQVPYIPRGSLSVQLYTTSTSPLRVGMFSSVYPRRSLCDVMVVSPQAGQCTVKQTHRYAGIINLYHP
ncbi:hypothetical protein Btru_044253 [Bulinus truncatus]|nr:hypothetical protein Btru_044253 [Bulinus truncatus]